MQNLHHYAFDPGDCESVLRLKAVGLEEVLEAQQVEVALAAVAEPVLGQNIPPLFSKVNPTRAEDLDYFARGSREQ